jgi:hypothetical protein
MRSRRHPGYRKETISALSMSAGTRYKKTNWVDVDIDGRAVLKLILKNYDGMILFD